MQLVLRFIIGGLVVSLFAVLSDLLKPKSFAGLFGAAPSVALATLGMTILAEGKMYAALEARSMVVGAVALGLYAYLVCWLLMRRRWRARKAATWAIAFWLACAVAAWFLVLR